MPCEGTILRLAEPAIGACQLGRDLSWDHGESAVHELVAADGTVYIGKAHRRAAKFADGLRAYRQWVPALDSQGLRLIGVDEPGQFLILSQVPGRTLPDDGDAGTHRTAGQLLRRFHDAAPPVSATGYAESERRRLDSWLHRARPQLLGDGKIAIARQGLALLASAPEPMVVPCHCDWQPRNWLVDDAGGLYTIDFEHARLWPWYRDLTRLWWEQWARRHLATIQL